MEKQGLSGFGEGRGIQWINGGKALLALVCYGL